MKARVKKWGNSLAVRIPKPLAAEIGLSENAEVELSSDRGRLVVSPLKRTRKRKYSLKEMLRGITPENLHGEIDFGPPVGKEVW
jgi:antitoxin MazE